MSERNEKSSVRQISLALAASILISIVFAPSANAEEPSREYIYGAELMSPAERDVYRRDLKKSTSDEARAQYRERHRERLQKRAQQRGVQLNERGIIRRDAGER